MVEHLPHRVRLAPALYLVFTISMIGLFVLWPELDLEVSAALYQPGEGFWLGRTALFLFAQRAIPYLTWSVIGGCTAITLCRQLGAQWVTPSLQKGVIYIFLCLALGPGLLTNVVLKDHWGRARPSQVVEFGGSKDFTPALIPTNQCRKNCSFVAGDPSVAFFFVAFAFITRRRQVAIFVTACAFGILVGVVRMAQGGHFLSDVVFAGVFTVGMVWLIHRIIFNEDIRVA